MATHSLTQSGPAPADDTAAHAVGLGFLCRCFVRLAATVACGAAVAGAIVYALLASDLGDYAESLTVLSRVRQSVVGAAAVSGVVQIVVTCTLVAVIALLASHKVAGPLARMIGCLRGVAQGRLPGPIRLRRGDQVGRLESRFNEVSRALAERHEALMLKVADVRDAEQALRRASGEPEERRAAAQRLRDRAAELASLLAAVDGDGEPGPEPASGRRGHGTASDQ